jgi:hypothetical protein
MTSWKRMKTYRLAPPVKRKLCTSKVASVPPDTPKATPKGKTGLHYWEVQGVASCRLHVYASLSKEAGRLALRLAACLLSQE